MNDKEKQELNTKIDALNNELREMHKSIYSVSKDKVSMFVTVITIFMMIMGYFGYDSLKEVRKEVDNIKNIRNEAEETAKEIDELYNQMVAKIEAKGIDNVTEEEKGQIKTLYKLKKFHVPDFTAKQNSLKKLLEDK